MFSDKNSIDWTNGNISPRKILYEYVTFFRIGNSFSKIFSERKLTELLILCQRQWPGRKERRKERKKERRRLESDVVTL